MVKSKDMTSKNKPTLSIIFLAIALVVLVFSCKKDPEPTIDQFELTKENLTVGTTTANIVATYDYSGKIEGIKVCVSEDGVHPDEFEAEINGTLQKVLKECVRIFLNL